MSQPDSRISWSQYYVFSQFWSGLICTKFKTRAVVHQRIWNRKYKFCDAVSDWSASLIETDLESIYGPNYFNVHFLDACIWRTKMVITIMTRITNFESNKFLQQIILFHFDIQNHVLCDGISCVIILFVLVYLFVIVSVCLITDVLEH